MKHRDVFHRSSKKDEKSCRCACECSVNCKKLSNKRSRQDNNTNAKPNTESPSQEKNKNLNHNSINIHNTHFNSKSNPLSQDANNKNKRAIMQSDDGKQNGDGMHHAHC